MCTSSKGVRAVRQNDKQERTYFRSERLVSMNGQWYFSTREGEQGPFPSKGAAERGLARFINETVELDGFQRSRRDQPAPMPRPISKGPQTLELVPIETATPTLEVPEPRLPSPAKRPVQMRSLVF